MSKYRFYTEFIESLENQNGLHRSHPFTPIDGAFALFQQDKWLTFCSHDYWGLAHHPEVKKSAMRGLLQHGITISSECQNLYTVYQRQLEEKLCGLLQRETALLFSSRHNANVTALSALGHENSALFLDEKSHPSLFQGAHESLAPIHSYHDLEQLEQLLHTNGDRDKIIITESIFGLTGEIAPLMSLRDLAKKYKALFYVDDTYAFGVMGPEGQGLCAPLKEIGIVSGSFSKACGASGGFIACPQAVRDYIMHRHPRKTHYLCPPPLIGALDAALELMGHLEGERKQLQQRSHWLRHALTEMGFSLSKANTPLISLAFNNEKEAQSLYAHLQEEQILTCPIRIAAQGSYRLNLVINIDHMPDHLTRLVEVIKTWKKSTFSLEAIAKC